jgi:ribonuclease P protein component
VLCRWRGDGTTRLGLAVSRKTARRAVDRNRIKRRVREGFRLRQGLLSGLDIVVIARPGIARYGNDELQRSLATHWSRLEKLKPRPRG